MFYLSKIFNWIFLSPLLFVILIFLGYSKCRQGKKNSAGIFLLSALILLYLLSIRPVKNLLVSPLEKQYRPVKIINCNLLVIPGGGVIESSPEKNRKPLLTDSSQRRCIAGYLYWRKLKVPIILSGGTPLAKGTPEALAMADFLRELGVPGRYLIIEPYSRNTYENVFNSVRIIKNRRAKRVAVITSAVHMPRTVKIFKSFKINCLALPTAYLSDYSPYRYYDFIPSAPDLTQSFAALHEYVGIAYYKLRYKI